MSNFITISVEFSFKGIEHRPSVVLDLEKSISKNLQIEHFHAAIAQNNEIDMYSYEFEVMQTSPIVYSEAKGLATDFLADGQFDYHGFVDAKDEQRFIGELYSTLDLNLESNPKIKEALLLAYRLGKEQGQKSS